MSPHGRQGPQGGPFVAHDEFTAVQSTELPDEHQK